MKTIELLSGIYLATWFLIFALSIFLSQNNRDCFKENSFVASVAAIIAVTIQTLIVFVPVAAIILIRRGL